MSTQPNPVPAAPLPLFPNYMELRARARVSTRLWSWARLGAVIAVLAYVVVLFVDPTDGLWLFWQLSVPLLPALFLLAPGVWRNVCPLAASNQAPRLLRFTRALTPPAWLREYGFVIGAVAFFTFASSRKWLFNHNAPATGLLILAALASALLGGYLFKGKSGWCTSICPLYPVQRLYNQTPFATVPNAHCSPCVGCTKNCYDFSPGAAYLSDLYDDDQRYTQHRKLFAAAMPGFVFAYFSLPDPTSLGSVLAMYLQFGLYMALSIGVFSLLDGFLKVSTNKITAVYGATAFNLFYWFGLPGWLTAAGSALNVAPPVWLAWAIRAGVLGVTIVWVARTYRKERLFLAQRRHERDSRAASPDARSLPFSAQSAQPAVTFQPGGVQFPVEAGRTLLEVAESHAQPIQSGCRMGACGADPVRILDGMENLAPAGKDELSTLSRLGLGPNCRLACMCRVTGPVAVSLDATGDAPATAADTQPAEPTPQLQVAAQLDEAPLHVEAGAAPGNGRTPAPAGNTPTAFDPASVTIEHVSEAGPSGRPEITFMPGGARAPVEAGRTLLEIAESSNQAIEAGCRMGVCGADPVLVLDGVQNLAPAGDDEKNTLERLGLGPNCRLACMCRPTGPVTVSLDARASAPAAPPPTPVLEYDRSLKSVVIVGNGIAGITAADYVRRHHPKCEIHIVSREKHHFYNRMAITRLIYGRSAMSGLYLQPEAWYDERRITCWLNTHVTHINRGHKQVQLATGESIVYDRLILASGSSSFVPPLPGYGLSGTFVLREAEEAMEIRAYVQTHQCRTAVIAGGGLLGLEAAYALHKMGLSVWVLERGEWLLRRQLDACGGHFLKQILEAMGLMIVTSAEAESVQGDDCVAQVTLKNGRTLPCDVFMVAAGIRPNVELARAAGLEVDRGVLVDACMHTSAPEIYAAGDVCEFSQEVPGLWPVAVEQAKVAAINAAGGHATYAPIVPVTMLKVAGVDMTSIGRIEVRSESEIEIILEDWDAQRYRKLVVADGKIVGAILLGAPADAQAVAAAIKEGRDISGCLQALRAGQWEVLQTNGAHRDHSRIVRQPAAGSRETRPERTIGRPSIEMQIRALRQLTANRHRAQHLGQEIDSAPARRRSGAASGR